MLLFYNHEILIIYKGIYKNKFVNKFWQIQRKYFNQNFKLSKLFEICMYISIIYEIEIFLPSMNFLHKHTIWILIFNILCNIF